MPVLKHVNKESGLDTHLLSENARCHALYRINSYYPKSIDYRILRASLRINSGLSSADHRFSGNRSTLYYLLIRTL